MPARGLWFIYRSSFVGAAPELAAPTNRFVGAVPELAAPTNIFQFVLITNFVIHSYIKKTI